MYILYFFRRKDKTSHCITIADAMCNATMKSTQEFSQLLSISIETLLQLCDDPDSDVRMVADESLNRIIRVSSTDYIHAYEQEQAYHSCIASVNSISICILSQTFFCQALMDNNIGKIQLELHKEIKKNGSARTLRAALWRFAELCHMIRLKYIAEL
jgi:huntingtin